VTTLPLDLDRTDSRPLGVQLAGQIRDLALRGTLQVGHRLPSTRSLAAELGVSRGVTEQAYDQLLAEGWLEARRGSGTFVAATAHPVRPAVRRTPPPARPTTTLVRLDSGTPWIDPRHRDGWRRAWREVSAATPPAGYPDPAGLPELRSAIATHLARTRGLTVTADDVVITAGTTDGLRHLLAVLPAGPVAIEDPGYRAAALVAEGTGREVVDLPIGSEGADASGVTRAAAIYVTPAHQHPLGITMSATARVRLLDDARRLDAMVVEDDYDSEFRYDVAPLPALATLDPDWVVYLGTASKSVAPGMRLGWLVAPRAVVPAVNELRSRTHDLPSWPAQRAYLAMLRDGHVDRLIRSARSVYAARGAAIAAALPGVTGPVAGMYVAVQLSTVQTRSAIAAARAAGFELPSLRDYTRSDRRAGVVFGFGGLKEEEFARALEAIAAALA